MQALVLLPALAAFLLAARRGFRASFVWVAIPCLLLLPAYYQWKLPGIPEISFWNLSFVVATCALFGGRDRSLYRFHWVDLVAVLLVLLCVHSEYSHKGFADARKVWALHMMGTIAPYLIGRAIARHDGLLVGTITVVAVVGAFIGLVAPYEARMGANPFDFLRGRWPQSVPWDGALYRSGLRRVAGPFAHPICHGFFFSMTLPLVWWLMDTRLLAARRWRRLLPLGHVVGLLLSLSRGPILGAMIAVGVMRAGWSRRRMLILAAVTVFGLIGLVVVADTLAGYASVGRGGAMSESQETAAYRWEMLENYLEVVRESPVIGFGKNQLPIVKGLKSIDNQYLFLTLQHGLPAAFAFLAMMVLPCLLLVPGLLRTAAEGTHARLGWALLGALLGAITTQVTVFAGTQTEQVLFLLCGIAVTVAGRLRSPGVPQRDARRA